MTAITKPGIELADRIGPHVGWTREILETCSLIARVAKSYERIQERWCCEEMSDRTTARLEVEEARLEALIRRHVESLPEPVGGIRVRVQFDGDPRGYTSRIVMEDGREVGLG